MSEVRETAGGGLVGVLQDGLLLSRAERLEILPNDSDDLLPIDARLPASFAFAPGRLVVVHEFERRLSCFSDQDGHLLWTKDLAADPQIGCAHGAGIACVGDSVFVITAKSCLVRVSLRDGSISGQCELRSSLFWFGESSLWALGNGIQRVQYDSLLTERVGEMDETPGDQVHSFAAGSGGAVVLQGSGRLRGIQLFGGKPSRFDLSLGAGLYPLRRPPVVRGPRLLVHRKGESPSLTSLVVGGSAPMRA